MPHFERYIGIDYSGAVTPDFSCKGLRIYDSEGSGEPIQVQPPPSPRRYWTRRGLAEWLCDELASDIPTIVGIDHGFSFPIAYFDRYRLPPGLAELLAGFPEALAYPRTSHLYRLYSARQFRAGLDADGREHLAPADGTLRWLMKSGAYATSMEPVNPTIT